MRVVSYIEDPRCLKVKDLPRHLQTRTEEKPFRICIFTDQLGALQHIATPLSFSNRVRLVALSWGVKVIIVSCLKEPSLKFMEEKHQTYSSCQTVTPTMEILWLRYINLLTEVGIGCPQIGSCRGCCKFRLVTASNYCLSPLTQNRNN